MGPVAAPLLTPALPGPSAAHLAAYAGLAPVTRRSGASIKDETRFRRGNHALKNALFPSAFASHADPTSRAYYDLDPSPAQAQSPLAHPGASPISLTRAGASQTPPRLHGRNPKPTPPHKRNQTSPQAHKRNPNPTPAARAQPRAVPLDLGHVNLGN